jgi:hypothetical protein
LNLFDGVDDVSVGWFVESLSEWMIGYLFIYLSLGEWMIVYSFIHSFIPSFIYLSGN